MVLTAKWASKTHAIKRVAEEEAWSSEFARSMKGSPQRPAFGRGMVLIPCYIKENGMEVTEVELSKEEREEHKEQESAFVYPKRQALPRNFFCDKKRYNEIRGYR